MNSPVVSRERGRVRVGLVRGFLNVTGDLCEPWRQFGAGDGAEQVPAVVLTDVGQQFALQS